MGQWAAYDYSSAVSPTFDRVWPNKQTLWCGHCVPAACCHLGLLLLHGLCFVFNHTIAYLVTHWLYMNLLHTVSFLIYLFVHSCSFISVTMGSLETTYLIQATVKTPTCENGFFRKFFITISLKRWVSVSDLIQRRKREVIIGYL